MLIRESSIASMMMIAGIAMSCSVQAQQSKEADKAQRIRQVLGSKSMTIYEGVQAKHRSFCTALYKALRSGSGDVGYQEPVVSTNEPDHPGLRKYEECRRQKSATSSSTFYGVAAIGSRDFRLYVVNANTVSGKGGVEYLYGEDSADSSVPRAMYARINLATCEYEHRIPVAAETSLEQVPELRGINAFVNFRDRYVIYSYSPGQLVVWGADPTHEDMRRGQICAWNPKTQPKTEAVELK
jgi:hypothetical protein